MNFDESLDEASSSYMSKNFNDPSFLNNQSYINCELDSDFPKNFFLQKSKENDQKIFLETVLNPNIIKVEPHFSHLACIYSLKNKNSTNMKSILLCLQNNINVLRMVSKALNLIEATENEDCVVATVSKTFYEAY